MTKLPPGFTHEIRQHLSDQDPPVDTETGVPVLDLENFCCGAHGFSALIETRFKDTDLTTTNLTLFDTGPDSRSIIRNVEAMQVPLDSIERVIVSHWHSDHTGGLLAFLKARRPGCVVDVHPDRPLARGIAPPPQDKVICRLPADPTAEQIRQVGGVIDMHTRGHVVANKTVWVSGEIPRVTEFEGGLLGGVRWARGEDGGGRWVKEEHIMDERYAAVDVAGKGLVIFSACSHAGIVNVVKDAIATFSRPIYMIIGGLHLAGPELSHRIPLTVEFLSRQLRPAPTYILPMHCSGFNAKVMLEEAFGEGCVPTGVGIKVEVRGDRDADKKLFKPVC